MKLLHLADLHLGRLFHERSLIEDQKFILDQVMEILSKDSYRAIILAGDIYDRSIPPEEAVILFSYFLNNLHRRFPDLAICLIAGNHDSPNRLAFGHELFRSMNIYIVSDPNLAFEPILLEAGDERCALFLLPFLYPGSLECTETKAGMAEHQQKEPRGLRTQQELIAEASRRLEARRQALETEGIHRSVLVAHLFTQGGMETESERIFIGTAEQIDVTLFSGFTYVALGHLHQRQQVAENAWYAGSPLAYSFSEAGQQKGCLSVEINNSVATATVQSINLIPLHPVRRIEGTFAELMQKPILEQEFANAYLEVELVDEHLIENAQRLLEQRYPLVLSVKQNRGFQTLLKDRSAIQGILPLHESRRRSVLDDFKAFEESINDSIDQDKLDLFSELLEQCNHETP